MVQPPPLIRAILPLTLRPEIKMQLVPQGWAVLLEAVKTVVLPIHMPPIRFQLELMLIQWVDSLVNRNRQR